MEFCKTCPYWEQHVDDDMHGVCKKLVLIDGHKIRVLESIQMEGGSCHQEDWVHPETPVTWGCARHPENEWLGMNGMSYKESEELLEEIADAMSESILFLNDPFKPRELQMALAMENMEFLMDLLAQNGLISEEALRAAGKDELWKSKDKNDG